MNIKRVLSGILGLPIVAIVFIFGNKYIIDIAISIISIISIYEYMKCVGEKTKPIKWVGYIIALFISFIHIIPINILISCVFLGIAILMTILFLIVIITELKIDIADIAITLFGIIYIVGFSSFIALLYGVENTGKYYIWYVFMATWGCDIFAYCIGKRFGKHRFNKISPNKSIEGCIAGTIGGILLVLVYTIILNTVCGMNINYIIIGIIGLILTIIGQIGDFAASSIKRYAGVKDFSNLIPGHGGMIDRIDSVIFAAPFAYYLLMMLI